MVRKFQKSLITAMLFLPLGNLYPKEYQYQGIGAPDVSIDVQSTECVVTSHRSDVIDVDKSCLDLKDGRVRLKGGQIDIDILTTSLHDEGVSESNSAIVGIKCLGKFSIGSNDYDDVHQIQNLILQPIEMEFNSFYSRQAGVIAFSKQVSEGGQVWVIKGKCGYGAQVECEQN